MLNVTMHNQRQRPKGRIPLDLGKVATGAVCKKDPPKRRAHQKEAIAAFHKSLDEGKNKMALVMATATGKTNVAIWCIEDYLKRGGRGKVLWIAHLDQIWQDANERFNDLLPKVSRGFYQGDNKSDSQADVIIAGVNTLKNGIDSKEIPFSATHFDFIVIDEFHHAGATTFHKVIDYFKPEVLLGMSCLKERHDKKEFLHYFGDNIIYEIDTVTAIKRKAIAGLKYYAIKDDVDYVAYPDGYQYTKLDKNRKLIIPEKDKRVIEKYLEIAPGKKTIAFCANINHTRAMADYLNGIGISAVAIHSKGTKEGNREKTLAFKNGLYQVACTVDKWLEGADIPDVEVGLFMRPSKSWRVFVQARGRVLRPSPGKQFGIIIDAVGNHKWLRRTNVHWHLLQEKLKQMAGELDISCPEADMPITRKMSARLVAAYKEVREKYIATFPDTQRTKTSSNKRTTKQVEAADAEEDFFLDFEEVKDHFFHTGEIPLTKEHLIQDFLDQEKELGRQPTSKEYKEKHHALKTITACFGSWNKFVKAMGKTPLFITPERRLTKEHLIQDFLDMEKELGRQPTFIEYKEKHHGWQPIVTLFGSWSKFVKAMGKTPLRQGPEKPLTKEHLIQDCLDQEKGLGRQPTKREYEKKHHSFPNKFFAGWIELVETARDKQKTA